MRKLGGDPKDQHNLSKIEKFHLSLCKEILVVKNNTSSSKVLGELGRFPFRITIETQLFKYLQRIPFVKKDCYLYRAFNVEVVNKESGCMTKMRHLLDSYGLSISISIKELLSISFSKKKLRIVASKPSSTLIKIKRTTFFHKQNNSLKPKDI